MTSSPQPAASVDFSRRQALSALGVGIGTVALSGCAAVATKPLGAPAAGPAQALLDSIAWNVLEHAPESATSLGVDTGVHSGLRNRLADRSRAGQDALAAVLRADLAQTRSVDTKALDPVTRTSFEVVESAYSTALEGFALPYGDVAVGGWRNTPYVVIQNVGGYLDFPRFMAADHPVRDAADAEAYLARLETIPAMLDGERDRAREARGMGMVPPAFLLDKALAAMEKSIADARDPAGAYVLGLTDRTDAIPGNWGSRARVLTAAIGKALERQYAELADQRGMADMDPGMGSQPRGEEYYRWALKASTTTSMSPDEVHREGLRQLDELHGRMEPILQEIGYTKGSVGARMTALSDDPRYKFAPGDPGRTAIMAFLEERIGWIKGRMPRAFDTLMPGNLEVRRIPEAEEIGAPGAYGGAGSKDGKIPGKMWINLKSTDLHRQYDLADLAYHETIPGHVWQGEYSNTLPLIRSILAFNAFSEGWALYAEQLADELGAYDEFQVGRLGYLQSLAFRACRMVVDTGLHAKRWTRQQGVDFFVERNGSKPDEVASEVDRYCSWPGQACGYKVGHSEIVRQRARAQAALGRNYDLRAFDDAVVLGGNAPLDVMARNVDRYIAKGRAAATG